jgi:CheY-like chemotaxis protein
VPPADDLSSSDISTCVKQTVAIRLLAKADRMDVRYALNPVGSLVGRHLLVVEDDKDARDVFCAILDYEGAMVLGTASAEEALRILRTVRPHAIMTEIALPGRDGFWLLEQLRASDRTAHIPVVAVTAVARRDEILDAGFDAFVAKPVRPEGVADAVLAALALRVDPDAPPID